MAPKQFYSLLITVFLVVTIWVASFCSSAIENTTTTYHTVQVSYLISLPPPKCAVTERKGDTGNLHFKLSPDMGSEIPSLKVVHKHGPCSSLGLDKASKPNHRLILAQDQLRVRFVQDRISIKQGINGWKDSKAELRATSDNNIGAVNYMVRVGLGTPKRDLHLIFDTATDLTWTQCQPCALYCYDQDDPIFDPSMSTSYANISCASTLCSLLGSAKGATPECHVSPSTCMYDIEYGDSSHSVGFFGKEKLTLTPTETFPDFMFGCGQHNRGQFGGVAGLLGLGRNGISVVGQTAMKYGKYFSYCLPSSTEETGHLTLGKTDTATTNLNTISFTPMLIVSPGSPFYGIRMNGITVGGTKLSIPSTIFSNAPQIIDSGTMITRLPPTAYTSLRDAFRKSMTMYPTAPAFSYLDTCYDFSGVRVVRIPRISLSFDGSITVDLHPRGVFYIVPSPWQFCLAFAPNRDDTDALIFGNVQQRTFTVVYDIVESKLGFAPEGCS